jgi:hypothetical protein
VNVKRGNRDTQTSAANFLPRLRCSFVFSRRFHFRAFITSSYLHEGRTVQLQNHGMQQLANGCVQRECTFSPPLFLFTSSSAPPRQAKTLSLTQVSPSHSSPPVSGHHWFLLDHLLRCPVIEVRMWQDCPTGIESDKVHSLLHFVFINLHLLHALSSTSTPCVPELRRVINYGPIV